MKIMTPLALAFALSACTGKDDGSTDDGSTDDSATTDDTSTETGTDGPAQVQVDTYLGSFVITLYEDEAPITAANFLTYVDNGFFDGDDGNGETTIHRVDADFVVQGGGYTADGSLKTPLDPITNEAAASGLSNTRGTLSMARTSDPNSATCQFFVNLVDNDFLDAGGSTTEGYAVFGEVSSGMDVVDSMGSVELSGESPVTPIAMTDVERL